MADFKTELRELSVLVGAKNSIEHKDDVFDYDSFASEVLNIVGRHDCNMNNFLRENYQFSDEEIQILRNGYALSKEIIKKFAIKHIEVLKWFGWDTQKGDPVDIAINNYNFSLKEGSHILKNMGLYQLLNCFTGSSYKTRNIFEDYAMDEYCDWFSATWSLLERKLKQIKKWELKKEKNKIQIESNIKFSEDLEHIILEYVDGINKTSSSLPVSCDFSDFKANTTSSIREEVFSKFINVELSKNEDYLKAKKRCALVASQNLAKELLDNLNYTNNLANFLGIYNTEYYYAKTTSKTIKIFKVPSFKDFKNCIEIDNIEASVPEYQANILTTIKNVESGKTLILRNECRFSHGQFNGTPEAKMYYKDRNDDLTVIYDEIR